MMRIDGVKVTDAKKPLDVLVTPADIASGDNKNPGGCAVAVALKRQLHVHDVRVHVSRVYVKVSPKEWVRYAAPESMRAEIIAFDRGGKFVPGVHRLKRIKPSIKLERKVKSKPPYKTKVPQRTPVKRGYHHVVGIRPHGANR